MDTLIRLFILCAVALVVATVVSANYVPHPTRQKPVQQSPVVDLCKSFELQTAAMCQKGKR